MGPINHVEEPSKLGGHPVQSHHPSGGCDIDHPLVVGHYTTPPTWLVEAAHSGKEGITPEDEEIIELEESTNELVNK
ncbi:MAG: hypothetical protein Phog2KO_44200 [Phototrophicaceae bacterium]